MARRKRWSGWAVALVVTTALAGCNSGGDGGSGGSGDPNAAPATAGGPMGTFPDAKLVLSRWAGDPWTSGQKDAAAQWSTATGGKLEIDALPYENLHDKQALTLQGAGGYDILYVHPSWFGEFAKAGYLAPIDDKLADAKRNPADFSAASFLPNVLEQGKYDGKQYCLPDFVSTIVLAYRKDVFEKANLKPPTTLDEVATDAAALNGKDGMAGIALPGKRGGAVADVMGSLLTAQGNWWYGTDGRNTLDKAAAAKAVDFYVKAAKSAPSGVLNFHVDEASTAAAQGKSAMIISTTPSLQALEDPAKSSTAGKWGYVPLAFTADKPAGELIYWNWCIAAKSQNQDAAYSFLQWYTSGAQQAKVAVAAATAGATKDFYTNPDVAAKLPFLDAMNKALTTSNPQPSLASWPKAQDQIELAVQEAIQGKKSPEQAADVMYEAVSAALGG
ncbi:ABC-type glycerol-3-phosphate transport system, substrate-binding protein [Asanoa hainanensis]|uniref:ABC-type glycerol-3-phosphate transport system, substrate-binding protein n=1 Tax=Asanoa hainanensis TaxID=560556 RepID=A0A239P0P6_9ACTN|nr:extracellular solute-binding protein [Asanoa hainanensis]SNT60707.1 ABC-type glycerol-3-phosphate transport system, substrate-binding protein [Asanoa hainanensis]